MRRFGRRSGTASTTTWWSRMAPGTTCGRHGSPAPTPRSRELEAPCAQDAEAGGEREPDAIAPGQVVHGAAGPRRDATAHAVAHAQHAADGAEASPRQELGRQRGDDGAPGAEA